MPQPSLLEGLSLMCADRLASFRVAYPLNCSRKLSSPVIVPSRARTVNAVQLFLFFPMCHGRNRLPPANL